MACYNPGIQPTNFVPVCASVICEAPGVIYVSIDPEVWKIRCRQCQEKAEHKCALKKLKAKFRPCFYDKKRESKDIKSQKKLEEAKKGKGEEDEEEEEDEGGEEEEREEEGEEGEEEEGGGEGGGRGGDKKKEKDKKKKNKKQDGKKKKQRAAKKMEEELEEKKKYSADLSPPPPIPDNYCACADRPMDVTPRPNVCSCEIYKPLNFMLELEVTGEYKPAYVPKARKGKE